MDDNVENPVRNEKRQHKFVKIASILTVFLLIASALLFCFRDSIFSCFAAKMIEKAADSYISDQKDGDIVPENDIPALQDIAASALRQDLPGVNGSSSSLTGFIVSMDQDETNISVGGEDFSVLADSQYENLMQMAETMKNPAFQAFAGEFAAAISDEIGNPQGGEEMFNAMFKAANSKKAQELAKKYANNPEFIKAMSELRKMSVQNVRDSSKKESGKETNTKSSMPDSSKKVQPVGNVRRPGADYSSGSPLDE